MLSFGHCSKSEGNIGKYGNGFKSGAMRVGKDALIFTKDETSMSIGFLSQTFLASIKAEEIVLPLISWNKSSSSLDSKFQDSLKTITTHSMFKTEAQLLLELAKIAQTGKVFLHG
jgi:hypothetical protein